ncbi:MAG: phosphate signaling complex protein PhoU [Myxococcales bacterium]|nr:MAG: phosphate signaling complex protein PhoU [Myxococcales bacterium]
MKHLDREIDRLKRHVLALSAIVEENVSKAVRAVMERDNDLATTVLRSDHQVDTIEVEVEEECLKILALHQPVALDLRFIVAVLKLNNDLERIGDLAVNIAEQVEPLSEQDAVTLPIDLRPIAKRAQMMLRDALDALVNKDPNSARSVCAADDEVDDLHREISRRVTDLLSEASAPTDVTVLIRLLSVSRCLERVADLATNIAEDIIYMTEGDIVRHGHVR